MYISLYVYFKAKFCVCVCACTCIHNHPCEWHRVKTVASLVGFGSGSAFSLSFFTVSIIFCFGVVEQMWSKSDLFICLYYISYWHRNWGRCKGVSRSLKKDTEEARMRTLFTVGHCWHKVWPHLPLKLTIIINNLTLNSDQDKDLP